MVNVCLIGYGRIGKVHADIIRQREDCKLDVICDIDETKIPIDIVSTTNYRQALSFINSDAGKKLVVIATPNGTHFEIANYFLTKGIPVLLEKPLTIDLSDAKILIDMAKSTNTFLFAVLQVRYNETVQILRDAILKNYLGRVFSVALCIRWNREQKYFQGWRGTLAMDGGALLNQGIHYVDVLQWLFGMPTELKCYTDMVNHDIQIEDEAFAVMKFENKIYGTLEFSLNTYPQNLECSLTVLGEKGTIKIGGRAMNRFDVWNIEGRPFPEIDIKESRDYGNYQGSCPNHDLVYDAVIKELNGESDATIIKGEEALNSLKLVHMLYASATSGKTVKTRSVCERCIFPTPNVNS